MNIYVSKTGSDNNDGSKSRPFLTISGAAQIADAGDTVIVGGGTYRECVTVKRGARGDFERITFKAADGEKAIIKGSQIINTWENIGKNIWKADIDNCVFGKYNPYAEEIDGDWLIRPIDKPLHTGQVYINGTALSEANEIIEDSGISTLPKMTWRAFVRDGITEIYANFAEYNPNEETAEINVRKSCFCAAETGVNYITVSGFEMAHAASQWSPPTSEQSGMICANWCKGWIIENNILHDARCSAVCVGKEASTGHNLHTRYRRKPGYQTQLESVFAAKHIGWSKETVGGHIIRNNIIYDCGQNAVVGNMGGAFSEIYNNHIYNIGNKHEFFGYEIAGIKLHAAIDTYIHDNVIHDCWYGTWLDWQAQGSRVSANLYYGNEHDLWIEVTHGPHLIDNNIFGSRHTLNNAAQGGAYIHNIFCGYIRRYDTLDRSTPYHLPHSTDIMGTAVVYGGDDRFYGNIFAGGELREGEDGDYGTVHYNGSPVSMEEYIEKAMQTGKCDVARYMPVRQPAYINNNVYLGGAKPFDREENNAVSDSGYAAVKEEDGMVYLEIDIPDGAVLKTADIIHTHSLPVPRISEAPFENQNGEDIVIDMDFFGEKRGEMPSAGAVEALTVGKQKILLYKKADA